MKIINREEFMKLPQGVIYSHYGRTWISGLYRKGESIKDIDYYEMDLTGNVKWDNSVEFFEILDKAEETGCSFGLDFECEARNGLFEEDSMYAVYEQDDINQLIEFLKTCKGI